MDYYDGRIFLKPNTRDTVSIYEYDMTLIKRIDLGVGGEGIGYDYRNNTFWVHDGNYFYEVDTTGTIQFQSPSPTYNNEAEGVLLLDNYVWITADEWIHGSIPNGNRAWKLKVK